MTISQIIKAWCTWVLMTSSSVFASAASSGQDPPGHLPHCQHEKCRYLGYNITHSIWAKYYYDIEGITIEISFDNLLADNAPRLDCFGGSALESPALPRFETEEHLLILNNCPLPTNSSIAEVLKTLNMLNCQETETKPCKLWLSNLPAAPLTAKHFFNLEHLQFVSIKSWKKPPIESNFLASLKSLRHLTIRGVAISELSPIPSLLDTLELYDTGIQRVPEAVFSLGLKTLKIEGGIPLDAMKVPPGVRYLDLVSTATTLQLDTMPSLVTLSVENWIEQLPKTVENCDALFGLFLTAPTMQALPENWLVNCSRLETVYIIKARNLITLPPILFALGGPLGTLSMRDGALETVPDSFFVHLGSSKLLENGTEFSSNIEKFNFRLRNLDLSWNNLDSSVFNALEHLAQIRDPSFSYHPDFSSPGSKHYGEAVLHDWHGPSINVLDLSHNPRIRDLCDAEGYSKIRRLKTLHRIHLNGTSISRICKDWREDMPDMWLLDLTNTKISKLAFEDLHFTRSVKAKVQLGGAPVTTIHVTREDFNQAVLEKPSLTSVHIDSQLNCDCRMYWTRRALERSTTLLSLPDIDKLHCKSGFLRDVLPEDMVCGAQEKCGLASLQDGCVCAARPDDDPTRDRWLVHVRCENNSRGFVLRRIYPFFPLHKSNNEGFYFTQDFNYLK